MDRMDTHFQQEDIEGKKEEALYVESILARNGYPRAFVKKVMREKEQKVKKFRTPELTWISVPYISGTSEAIGRALRPLGISFAHRSESWKWPVSWLKRRYS